MKVKEMIEELKKLDQEREIWIFYDCYSFMEPSIDEVPKEDIDRCSHRGARPQLGDYKMDAW